MRKIKRSNILILGIFMYLIFQILTVFLGESVQTMALQPEELELKITTQGLIIRDEYVIDSSESGSIERLCERNEKIKKSQNIANIYTDNKVSDINSQIDKLNEEIDEIQNKLNDEKSDLIKDINQSQLTTKVEQRKILEDQKEESIKTINSNSSGIVSYTFDGNEEKYTLENFKNITKKDIENESNNYTKIPDDSKIKRDEPIARVINTNEIYIAICVNNDEIKNFEINQEVQIQYKEENIDAKVYEIHNKESENVIILKTMNQNVGIYDTRVEEFDIIYKQIEGLKIPKNSIEVVDEKNGVYVVNQQTQDLEFIEIKGIEYENEEFVFVDYYSNGITGTKTVDLYDEIILHPNGINKHIKVR